MVKLTVMIDDKLWPKLTAVCIRENADGTVTSSKVSQQYDTAYTVFENALHNHLKPMVGEINDRRLKHRP